MNQWKWRLKEDGYAVRSQHIRLGINNYTSKQIWMHRLINNTAKDLFTDHIDRNKLNNVRKNLRTVNKSLNGINRGKPKNNKSGYKGVYWDSWSKKWRAELEKEGKRMRFGRFINIKDAVFARKQAEQKYYETI